MKRYLAIDLGGTAIKYGVVDEELNFLSRGKVPSRCETREQFMTDIKAIYDECGKAAEGMAISMPGVIDRIKGYAYSGGSFKWIRETAIAHDLADIVKARVTICNDAKAAALAELGFGNLRGVRNGVALILGTGIGGAIIINGELVDGSHYSSGEFSFLRENVRGDEELFLDVNGVAGLKAAVKETSGRDNVDGLTAFKLIKEKKDEKVLTGVRNFCKYLAVNIYNLQGVIDANRFVIGGGISNEPMFIDILKEAVSEAFATARIKVFPLPEIKACRFQSDANMIGAVYNFQQIIEGKP